VYGGVCLLCEQFQPTASLNTVNATYVEIQFSTDMTITSLSSYMSIEMKGYSVDVDYTYVVLEESDKLYVLNFTYLTSLPLRPLKVTFTDATKIVDTEGYQLKSSSLVLSTDLPSITSASADEKEVSQTLTDWALYVIYFMIASFPVLSFTGDLGIFWGLVDSAQVMNYLLYVNFSLPFNVKQFYQAMSIANLNFLPNIIWDILEAVGTPIDLSDQSASDIFVERGVLYVNFLYNGGRILSIYIILAALYGIVTLISNIDFESEQKREFFQKVRGWMIFAQIRMFLVGYLQLVFAVVLQISKPSYKDIFSMVSVVLAIGFLALVIWFPINIIIQIEGINQTQKATNKNVDSFLKRVIVEYKFDNIISRNFVFFLLLRNIALVPVLIFLTSVPLTQSGVFLNVSLVVSLFVAAIPIYNSPSYTVINLSALAGFGVIGCFLFWMIGSSTFSGSDAQAETYFSSGEAMEITSLVVLVIYALHVLYQLLVIGVQYVRKFLKEREEIKKKEAKEKILKETEKEKERAKQEASRISKTSGIELSVTRRSVVRFDETLNSENSLLESPRKR